jgi:hypothetical protein
MAKRSRQEKITWNVLFELSDSLGQGKTLTDQEINDEIKAYRREKRNNA